MIIMSLHSVNPGMKVTTMTPYFYSIFGLCMYIFHLVRGQENLNSRSKMAHLPLKSGNVSCLPPYNMAKTLSYRVKTTSKLFVAPFSMAKTFSAPPFCRGKTSRAPPPPVL